ncbi:MAG: CHAD domain-containing protein [Gaiellaceae bacterium]
MNETMENPVRQSLEREIKLEANNGFILPELPGRKLEPEVLVSTYYDTSDLRLATAGLTLRRRVKAGASGPVWQLKLPRGDARAELECPAPNTTPPAELTHLLVAHTRGRALHPAATLRTRRAGVRVRGIEGDLADVVVDDVDVLDGERVVKAFTEVEVELIADAPSALEQIERVLIAAGAVQGETRPKLLQALDVEPTRPPHAPRPGDPTSVHVRSRIARQRDAIVARDPGTRLGTDPEELHQMRVAVRRLRALLRATSSVQLGQWSEPLADDLRWLGGMLGPVRDADVLLERFQQRSMSLSPGLQDPFSSALRPIVDARTVARAELRDALDSTRYLLLLDRLDQAALHALLDDQGPTLEQLARKEFKRLKKRLCRLVEESSDDELHAVRIAGKRARYATELASGTMKRDAAKFLRSTKRLQDVLGEHQDACIAETELFRLAAATRSTDSAFAVGIVVERERASQLEARGQLPAARRELEHAARGLWR